MAQSNQHTDREIRQALGFLLDPAAIPEGMLSATTRDRQYLERQLKNMLSVFAKDLKSHDATIDPSGTSLTTVTTAASQGLMNRMEKELQDTIQALAAQEGKEYLAKAFTIQHQPDIEYQVFKSSAALGSTQQERIQTILDQVEGFKQVDRTTGITSYKVPAGSTTMVDGKPKEAIGSIHRVVGAYNRGKRQRTVKTLRDAYVDVAAYDAADDHDKVAMLNAASAFNSYAAVNTQKDALGKNVGDRMDRRALAMQYYSDAVMRDPSLPVSPGIPITAEARLVKQNYNLERQEQAIAAFVENPANADTPITRREQGKARREQERFDREWLRKERRVLRELQRRPGSRIAARNQDAEDMELAYQQFITDPANKASLLVRKHRAREQKKRDLLYRKRKAESDRKAKTALGVVGGAVQFVVRQAIHAITLLLSTSVVLLAAISRGVFQIADRIHQQSMNAIKYNMSTEELTKYGRLETVLKLSDGSFNNMFTTVLSKTNDPFTGLTNSFLEGLSVLLKRDTGSLFDLWLGKDNNPKELTSLIMNAAMRQILSGKNITNQDVGQGLAAVNIGQFLTASLGAEFGNMLKRWMMDVNDAQGQGGTTKEFEGTKYDITDFEQWLKYLEVMNPGVKPPSQVEFNAGENTVQTWKSFQAFLTGIRDNVLLKILARLDTIIEAIRGFIVQVAGDFFPELAAAENARAIKMNTEFSAQAHRQTGYYTAKVKNLAEDLGLNPDDAETILVNAQQGKLPRAAVDNWQKFIEFLQAVVGKQHWEKQQADVDDMLLQDVQRVIGNPEHIENQSVLIASKTQLALNPLVRARRVEQKREAQLREPIGGWEWAGDNGVLTDAELARFFQIDLATVTPEYMQALRSSIRIADYGKRLGNIAERKKSLEAITDRREQRRTEESIREDEAGAEAIRKRILSDVAKRLEPEDRFVSYPSGYSAREDKDLVDTIDAGVASGRSLTPGVVKEFLRRTPGAEYYTYQTNESADQVEKVNKRWRDDYDTYKRQYPFAAETLFEYIEKMNTASPGARPQYYLTGEEALDMITKAARERLADYAARGREHLAELEAEWAEADEHYPERLSAFYKNIDGSTGAAERPWAVGAAISRITNLTAQRDAIGAEVQQILEQHYTSEDLGRMVPGDLQIKKDERDESHIFLHVQSGGQWKSYPLKSQGDGVTLDFRDNILHSYQEVPYAGDGTGAVEQ